MPKVFKTPADSPDNVEIVGAGVAASYGRGGISVDEVAQIASELQTIGGKPLSGRELKDAAEAFAESRGLVVAEMSERKVQTLPQEWGVPPEPQPAGEVAVAEHERIFGGGEEEEEAETPEPAPEPPEPQETGEPQGASKEE